MGGRIPRGEDHGVTTGDSLWYLNVMSDTTCYLGWLYSFFDVAQLAAPGSQECGGDAAYTVVWHRPRDRGTTHAHA